MAGEPSRRRIRAKTFLNDFVRGASEEELRERFDLTDGDLQRVVGALRAGGQLTTEVVAKRKENLRIRFGDDVPAPQDERPGGVSVDLDTGLVLHCPSCGAAVKRRADRCAYCRSPLDFSLKGKTVHCPRCFQRTPASSRFCVSCARPMKDEVQHSGVLSDKHCPRCRVLLHGRKVGEFSVMVCDSCLGMFIPHETFEMMQDTSDRAIEQFRGLPRGRLKLDDTIRYVRCPVCRQMMNRTNFGRISGVIVDTCRDHGIWFDAGEMEKIMDFIAKGGVEHARKIELERIKHEADLLKAQKDRISSDMRGQGFGDYRFDKVDDGLGVGIAETAGRVIMRFLGF